MKLSLGSYDTFPLSVAGTTRSYAVAAAVTLMVITRVPALHAQAESTGAQRLKSRTSKQERPKVTSLSG